MRKIAKPIIELSNICRSDKKSEIERLNISVPYGDSFAVVYKNEKNISLLLEILGGRVSPTKGKIFFKGDDITGTKNNFGIISKSPSLPKNKTVVSYAAAQIAKRGLPRSTAEVLAKKELKLFGHEEIAEVTYSKLTPRLAARALVFSAYMCSHELMVIDEPFGEIPTAERTAEFEWFNEFRKSNNVSTLIFTQSPETAVELSDYVMAVDDKTESKGIVAVDKRKKEDSLYRVRELL